MFLETFHSSPWFSRKKFKFQKTKFLSVCYFGLPKNVDIKLTSYIFSSNIEVTILIDCRHIKKSEGNEKSFFSNVIKKSVFFLGYFRFFSSLNLICHKVNYHHSEKHTRKHRRPWFPVFFFFFLSQQFKLRCRNCVLCEHSWEFIPMFT